MGGGPAIDVSLKATVMPGGRTFTWFYPTLGPTGSKRLSLPEDYGYSKKSLKQKSLEITFTYSDLLGSKLQTSMKLGLGSFADGLGVLMPYWFRNAYTQLASS